VNASNATVSVAQIFLPSGHSTLGRMVKSSYYATK
jgi:hypothetical protein